MNFPAHKSNFEFQMITCNEISIKNQNVNSVRSLYRDSLFKVTYFDTSVIDKKNIYTIGRTTINYTMYENWLCCLLV